MKTEFWSNGKLIHEENLYSLADVVDFGKMLEREHGVENICCIVQGAIA